MWLLVLLNLISNDDHDGRDKFLGLLIQAWLTLDGQLTESQVKLTAILK